MRGRKKGPMPRVNFDGKGWALKSRSTEVPDLSGMERVDALLWLNRNTRPSGYSKGNPLAGVGTAVTLVSQ